MGNEAKIFFLDMIGQRLHLCKSFFGDTTAVLWVFKFGRIPRYGVKNYIWSNQRLIFVAGGWFLSTYFFHEKGHVQKLHYLSGCQIDISWPILSTLVIAMLKETLWATKSVQLFCTLCNIIHYLAWHSTSPDQFLVQHKPHAPDHPRVSCLSSNDAHRLVQSVSHLCPAKRISRLNGIWFVMLGKAKHSGKLVSYLSYGLGLLKIQDDSFEYKVTC